MEKLYNKAIELLREISQNIDNDYEKDIEEIENLLNDDSYKIAVIGEFSVGKSTFLNSIIGKRILYSSAQEATGVLTTIKNSEKMLAEIIYDDSRSEPIGLSKENSYFELKSYLDKNRNDNKNIKNVNISYPIVGIDKDVLLLDTPGLQGIRDKELLITKEVLKEAHATIVLVDYKGLTGTELNLLKGNLKEFGRIKTKEIILVINKISELYSTRSKEEALAKINRVVESVKATLKENSLDNIKVFALDSRDYLWGRDVTLFNQVIEESDSNVNKLLTQEEYLERSSFNVFREYLNRFLSKDSRTKAFYEDIKERILILLEEFKKELQKNKSEGLKDIDSILNNINLQKNLILENRRVIINSTLRQLMESNEEFARTMESDIKDEVSNGKKQVLLYIKDNIKCYDDLNNGTEKNLEKYVQDIVNKSMEPYAININKYKENINSLLSNTFNKEFKKVFKESGKINFTTKEDEVKVSLEYKNNANDSILTELETRIKEMEEELRNNKQLLNKYNLNYGKEIQNLEAKIRVNKVEMKNEISLLGKKPDPVQKYRTETRTRRKWLIFTEEYDVKVPDGLDHSKGIAWESKRNDIIDRYSKTEKVYQDKIDKLYDDKIKAENINKKIHKLQIDIDNLKVNRKQAAEKMEQLISNSKQIFFESKKEELYISFSELLGKYFRMMLSKLKEILEEYYSYIKNEVTEQANHYLNAFEKTLNEKYKQAIERIKDLKIDKDKNLDKLNDMEKLINAEG